MTDDTTKWRTSWDIPCSSILTVMPPSVMLWYRWDKRTCSSTHRATGVTFSPATRPPLLDISRHACPSSHWIVCSTPRRRNGRCHTTDATRSPSRFPSSSRYCWHRVPKVLPLVCQRKSFPTISWKYATLPLPICMTRSSIFILTSPQEAASTYRNTTTDNVAVSSRFVPRLRSSTRRRWSSARFRSRRLPRHLSTPY